eukprot:CAMPEP_0194064954 /NCGR_PEP_ID=MMETSP0009_2-20130614/84419_1 /TAXON_ID=210454 /ORGANISM="Grammatophora oceanica, Strain CCMP 410" /LENGTH=37 /DNA_ID= /DNA_START= /DNA_END= /DNA_ORIENTATION=
MRVVPEDAEVGPMCNGNPVLHVQGVIQVLWLIGEVLD